MKLEDVKDKIDNYFDNVTPEQFIKDFEESGFEFEPLSEEDLLVLNQKITEYE